MRGGADGPGRRARGLLAAARAGLRRRGGGGLHEFRVALRRRARRLERRETPRRLHRLRVAAKALRYQLEPYGRRAGFPSGARLRGLQRALGEVHDRDLILGILGRWRAPAEVAERARAQRAAALGRARRLWRGLGSG